MKDKGSITPTPSKSNSNIASHNAVAVVDSLIYSWLERAKIRQGDKSRDKAHTQVHPGAHFVPIWLLAYGGQDI